MSKLDSFLTFSAYRNNKFEKNPNLSEATKKKIRFRQYQARTTEKALLYIFVYPFIYFPLIITAILIIGQNLINLF